MAQLFEVTDDGKINWYPHKFQMRALESTSRFTFILKGWRGGFTSWAAKWLESEMRRCGPGNLNLSYFAISPTHKVGEKGLIPAIQTVFCTHLRYAEYNKNDRTFTITPEGERALWGHSQKEPTKVVACYAEDPDSFASLTGLGGVADEIGQKKFKYDAWNTLRARCATASGQMAPGGGGKMGRIFAGSTVYYLGWLEDFWNEWLAAAKQAKQEMLALCAETRDPQERLHIQREFNRRLYLGQVHPEFNFIRFDSTANPAFPPEEFEAMRRQLPAWLFDMRYRAIFRKPAGVILEDWSPQRHFVKAFHLPSAWPRYGAIDPGRKNFHATFWAHDRERDRHFLFARYHRSDLQLHEHGALIAKTFPGLQWVVAGQPGESYERTQLGAGGLACVAPDTRDLWSGIASMGAAIRADKVFVFQEEPDGGEWGKLPDGFGIGCAGFNDEARSYARPIDDKGNPLMDAEPEDKETYHYLDTGRYYGTKMWAKLQATAAPVSGAIDEINPQSPPPPDTIARRTPVSASAVLGRGVLRENPLLVDSGDRMLDAL